MPLKPRATGDVQRAGSSAFRAAEARVALAPSRRRGTGYWLLAAKAAVVLVGISGFVAGSAYAPANYTFAQTPEEERAALESQLKAIETEIAQHQAQVASYRAQGKTLSAEKGKLDAQIASLTSQMKALTVSMNLLDRKIGSTEAEIEVTVDSLAQNQEVLAELIRKAYVADQATLLEVMLQHGDLSEFFTDVNGIESLQENVRGTIGTISSLKGQLEGHVVELSDAKSDALTAQQYQAAQKLRADQVAKEKAALLAATKGQESKYAALLKEKQAQAAQIRSRLFSFLGGGQMQFGDAYQIAKTAGQLTGVRPALILAVLNRESALGANVGKCNYKSSMSPTQQPAYLEITSELGIDPDSVMVSCAIVSDGAYGGAMGPAQFMPNTWQGYKARIASLTGHRPPSPWNNMDAVTATALYMKDAGAVAGNTESERVAAAKYYAGGNWPRFLNTYGNAVVDGANGFEDDIAIIEGR